MSERYKLLGDDKDSQSASTTKSQNLQRKIFLVWAIAASIAAIAAPLGLHLTKKPCNNLGANTQPSIAQQPNPAIYGQWETVVPNELGVNIGANLGQMSVHTVLLPSGKVLMVSGSSWRNKVPTETYPQFNPPANWKGVFLQEEYPFANTTENWDEYFGIVNYNGILDPVANTFFRIPHPRPEQDPNNASQFSPTDLFCTGHLHLQDGTVLFVGGTQYYTPWRSGHSSTFLFDWQKELTIDWTSYDWTQSWTQDETYYPWIFSGFTIRGRWYPHMVPLLDGRMVIFSGFFGIDDPTTFDPMYMFEINYYVEIFDPEIFDPADPLAAWKRINIQNMTDSPFATLLDPAYWTEAATQCEPPASQRQCDAYKRDAFKLYPNNYLMPDGRIFMTREGDFNSLRTPDGEYMRYTNYTYYMTVGGTREDPTVSFERGPDLPLPVGMSGTTVLDPNSGKILKMGGMPLNGGTLMPGQIAANSTQNNITSLASQFAGSRGSRQLEVFTLPTSINDIGSWELQDLYWLGDTADLDRTMFNTIILPTKELLVINGGNYDFFGSVYTPILMTPNYQNGVFQGTYTQKNLVNDPQPRSYHSGALLLPDGRILVVSGNGCRAIIDPSQPQANGSALPGQQAKFNPDRVQLNLYQFTDSSVGQGFAQIPAENWIAEYFSPPYLFIDGVRRAAIANITWTGTGSPGYQPNTVIQGQIYYLWHSQQPYTLTLDNLPEVACNQSATLALIKLPSATHGWDSGQRFFALQFTQSSPTTQISLSSLPAAQTQISLLDFTCSFTWIVLESRPWLKWCALMIQWTR